MEGTFFLRLLIQQYCLYIDTALALQTTTTCGTHIHVKVTISSTPPLPFLGYAVFESLDQILTLYPIAVGGDALLQFVMMSRAAALFNHWNKNQIKIK